ncbi:hypothetical protein LguiA_024173 [Lonicera macranthoides]
MESQKKLEANSYAVQSHNSRTSMECWVPWLGLFVGAGLVCAIGSFCYGKFKFYDKTPTNC